MSRMSRLCVGLVALWLAAPAFAAEPPKAWVERQNPGQEGAESAARKEAPTQHCRVVKEWKVGEVVAQHRVCEDAPNAPAAAAPEKRPTRT
ncbi:hypothetical protein [Stenotrophomonas rhizophila]|uniref:hypothetical protein n=1 Tax=Stenotrophomonas rhizophila TaxID=216778 RepID=UPI0028AD5EBD|nr:hypothetical protein [Stenotrophomonas rhizophila]